MAQAKHANTVSVMFRHIPKSLYRALKVEAARREIFLRDLIIEYLAKGINKK